MNGTTGTAALLWEWQRLIFILPFGIGALFLLLSAVRGGGHRHIGHGFGHGHGLGHGHGIGHGAGHGVAHGAGHGASHPVGSPHGHVGSTSSTTHHHGASGPRNSQSLAGGPAPFSFALVLFGIGRAPLPMVIEFFLICWGVTGFWSLENLVRNPHPNLFQMLPILGIALIGGWLGSRGAAELIGRLMPRDESTVVSGDALYGLTGKVAFPVSEKSGRVLIYDEFGTLHDEMCRVPDGHPLITRGTTIRIVDRDPVSGRLIVEEALSPLPTADK